MFSDEPLWTILIPWSMQERLAASGSMSDLGKWVSRTVASADGVTHPDVASGYTHTLDQRQKKKHS